MNVPVNTLPTPERIEADAAAVGYSMTEICKQASVDYSGWWRWKTGRADIKMTTVQRLLDAIEAAKPENGGAA